MFAGLAPFFAYALLGAGYHYSTFRILICCLLSFHTVPMYIMFLFEVPRISPALYFLSYTASLQTSVSGWLSEQLENTLVRGIFSLQDERRPWKYAPKETSAPPKHIPVPIRRTTSTPRMFAQAGLLSMAKKFMLPKIVSTKKMRRKLRRSFIDCPFNWFILFEILS